MAVSGAPRRLCTVIISLCCGVGSQPPPATQMGKRDRGTAGEKSRVTQNGGPPPRSPRPGTAGAAPAPRAHAAPRTPHRVPAPVAAACPVPRGRRQPGHGASQSRVWGGSGSAQERCQVPPRSAPVPGARGAAAAGEGTAGDGSQSVPPAATWAAWWGLESKRAVEAEGDVVSDEGGPGGSQPLQAEGTALNRVYARSHPNRLGFGTAWRRRAGARGRGLRPKAG